MRPQRLILPADNGRYEIVLDVLYSPVEQQWRHVAGGVMFLWVQHMPRWNDLIKVGIHTYRATNVTFIDDGEQRRRWVCAQWHACEVSPAEELRLLDESIRCLDCHVDCHEADWNYMVQNEIWARYVGRSGMLCIPCLEKRMGRRLRRADFIDVPITRHCRNPVVRDRFKA